MILLFLVACVLVALPTVGRILNLAMKVIGVLVVAMLSVVLVGALMVELLLRHTPF